MYLEISKSDKEKERKRLLRYQETMKKKREGGKRNCR